MKERAAVERVMERIYKDRLRKTGRLPGGKGAREIEDRVKKAAEETDNIKKRK